MVMRTYELQLRSEFSIVSKLPIIIRSRQCQGGGYIWHTTGSGKTLTSFKTARLASKLPYIDKVLFVVDRKDLIPDYERI